MEQSRLSGVFTYDKSKEIVKQQNVVVCARACVKEAADLHLFFATVDFS